MTNARFCIIPARALGDKRLNRTDIMVLNALGMFGDTSGWSFPSTKTIAEKIGGHRVSVSKALANLSECGYVESRTRRRKDGGQTSNEYRILFDLPTGDTGSEIEVPAAPEYDDEPPVADTLPPCSETATPPVASGTTPPVAQPLHHINEPILTPQGNPVSNETSAEGAPSVSGAVDFKKVLFTEGLKMLGGNPNANRSLVGRWIRDFGEAAVVAAMLEAQQKSAVEPKAYIETILKKGGKKHGSTGGRFTEQNYRAGSDGFIVT